MGDHPYLLESTLNIVIYQASSREQSICSCTTLYEVRLQMNVKGLDVRLYQVSFLLNNSLRELGAFFGGEKLNQGGFETLLGNFLVLSLV